MVYFLIVLGLGLVLAPVMWLRPSPRDKQLQRLRQRAVEKGLRVNLGAMPQRQGSVKAGDQFDTACYLLPWPKQQLIQAEKAARQTQAIFRGTDGVWRDAGLGDLLSDLPDSAQVVDVNVEGVCVYWRETGTETRVDELAEFLRRIRERLLEQA